MFLLRSLFSLYFLLQKTTKKSLLFLLCKCMCSYLIPETFYYTALIFSRWIILLILLFFIFFIANTWQETNSIIYLFAPLYFHDTIILLVICFFVLIICLFWSRKSIHLMFTLIIQFIEFKFYWIIHSQMFMVFTHFSSTK